MAVSGRDKYIIRQYLYEVPYWIFTLLVFVIVRFGGLTKGHAELLIFYDKPTALELLAYTTLSGILLGVLITTLRIFLFNELCKAMAVGKSILLQAIGSLFVFLGLVFLYVLMQFFSLGYSIDTLPAFITLTFNFSSAAILMGFFFYASIQFSLILEADKKLGMNVLANLVLGKYHRPKQENRIFMFLDMKGSTTTAEKLGHLKYSRYLQEVFTLITDLVIDFKAEIYQFVGDEVVLSWKSSIGYRENNALHFFYGFQDILEANRDYFKRKYGAIPFFKAAIHRGDVSVAEVGEISTQIAYHGDVVNTTSRIQELCNKYEANLLVSEKFMIGMESPPANFKENAAEISLRGRSQPVTVYTLELASSK